MTARQPGFVAKVPMPDAIWPCGATLTRRMMTVNIGKVVRVIVVEAIIVPHSPGSGQRSDPKDAPLPVKGEPSR